MLPHPKHIFSGCSKAAGTANSTLAQFARVGLSPPRIRDLEIALICLSCSTFAGMAAQLPERTFTKADGLPRNLVTCLVSDSRGFLWLCTAEGLARYDGYQFRSYGVEQGLPSRLVNTVLE